MTKEEIIKALESLPLYSLHLNYNYGSPFIEREYDYSGDYLHIQDLQEVIEQIRENDIRCPICYCDNVNWD